MVQELGDWPGDTDFGIIDMNYSIIVELQTLRERKLREQLLTFKQEENVFLKVSPQKN